MIALLCRDINVNAAVQRLYEGDECFMGNRNGICTRDSQCKTIEHEIKNNLVKIDDIICSVLHREALICCKTEETPKSDTAQVKFAQRPSKIACDKITKDLYAVIGKHVLNGEEVHYGEYPFLAHLGYVSDDESIDYRCGGTLIEQRFVLTAAHCILKENNLKYVRFGVNNIDDDEERKNGDIVTVKQIFVHCGYYKSYNDIAIIELERDVKYNTNIRPVCLTDEMNEAPPNTNVSVAGWGWTNVSFRNTSTILLKGIVEVVDLQSCNVSYSTANPGLGFGINFEFGLANTHLCAHDYNNKTDSCRGDSGGPLILAKDVAIGDYRIIGIVSTGYGCASNIPGLYTRVGAFIDFIEDIVWHKKPYKCL